MIENFNWSIVDGGLETGTSISRKARAIQVVPIEPSIINLTMLEYEKIDIKVYEGKVQKSYESLLLRRAIK